MTAGVLPPQAEETTLLGLPPVPPDDTRRYGSHPSQVIDYYRPAAPWSADRPRHRVTLLHGGFWRDAYDRGHASPLAAALAGHGFAVALAEYRRVGGGGGWPATFDDVAQLVEAAWPVGERHLLVGHSAGGQLALWAARRRYRAPLGGVVAVSPVADLRAAHRLGLSRGAVAELLGTAGELAVLDPMQLPPCPVPEVVLHGSADQEVPVAFSRRYAAAGGAVLRELPGVGHYGPLIPGSESFRELLAALDTLLAAAPESRDGRR